MVYDLLPRFLKIRSIMGVQLRVHYMRKFLCIFWILREPRLVVRRIGRNGGVWLDVGGRRSRYGEAS